MDLHPLLRTMHAFGQTVEIKSLDAVARQKVSTDERMRMKSGSDNESFQIFESIVRSRTGAGTIVTNATDSGHEGHLDFVSLAYLAEGYTPADIRDLVDNAVQNMLIRVIEGSSKVSV